MKYKPPTQIWILIDRDNGDCGAMDPEDRTGRYNYLWWFFSKEDALQHMEWQKEQKFAARLEGPFLYEALIKEPLIERTHFADGGTVSSYGAEYPLELTFPVSKRLLKRLEHQRERSEKRREGDVTLDDVIEWALESWLERAEAFEAQEPK